MNTVWVVEEGYDTDNDYGDWNWSLDEDHQVFFTSAADAEAYIEKVYGDQRRAYEARVEEYHRKQAAWEKKNARLRELGGRNAETYPYRPREPNRHRATALTLGEA